MKGAAAILAALMILLGTACESAALGASEVAAGVQRKYYSLKDLSADFRQESRLATLGRPRVKSGKIYFAKGGRMRWEYDPPDPQLIVSDGRTIWFYRPEKKQVVMQELGAAFTNQTPLLFLFGEGDLAGQFSWEPGDLAPGPAGSIVLSLKPRQETPDLTALTLEVRPGDFTIAATVLEDAFGNVTRLEFSGEKEDQGLDEGRFSFQVPSGAEVIGP